MCNISPWPVQRGNARGRCGWFLLRPTAPPCPPGLLSPQSSYQSPQRTAAPSWNTTHENHQTDQVGNYFFKHLEYKLNRKQMKATEIHISCWTESNVNDLAVRKRGYWLQQLLGFTRRVIRSVSTVFLGLLVQSQQLGLQLAAESWQGVPDVVGQLLWRHKGRKINKLEPHTEPPICR